MRPIMFTFGILLALVAVGVVGVGAALWNLGESCARDARCQDDGFVIAGAVGVGMVVGGVLLGGGGLALIIGGAVGERRKAPREIPVRTTDEKTCPKCRAHSPLNARHCGGCGLAFLRPCPQCNVDMGRDARFCTACGAAVAPLAA